MSIRHRKVSSLTPYNSVVSNCPNYLFITVSASFFPLRRLYKAYKKSPWLYRLFNSFGETLVQII